MEEDNVELRSGRSVDKVYVKFVNLTNRMIEIIWVNYSGLFERYSLLRSRQHMDVNTYKSHPWIAIDIMTKDRMHLNKNFIYQPVPWKEYCESNLKFPVIPPVRRFVVCITLPVYSLRYRTLLQIRDLLKNPEDVEKLELPNSLVVDLKRVFELKEAMQVIVSGRPQ